MPDFPRMSMQQRVSQSMAQVQSQKMSQAQIMSLNMLAMSSPDLRNEIYKYAERNPALEIKSDSLETGVSSSRTETAASSRFSDTERYGRVSAAGVAASDNFQAALESNADFREPLADHLEHQLNAMNISDEEKSVCRKLIYNLDEKGFHILAPITFLNLENPLHTERFLKKCLCIVQNLDPIGTCTNNYVESLFVQAKISGLASDLTLFLLESHLHFSFLNPPQIPKIKKKIADYLEDQKNLKFQDDDRYATVFHLQKEDFTDEEIQISLDFIKTLDPFPARNFGNNQSNFISPDVTVTKNPDFQEKIPSQTKNDKIEKNHQNQGETDKNQDEPEFIVTFAREFLPKVQISKEYSKLIQDSATENSDSNENPQTSERIAQKKAELKFARSSVNDAKVFIDSILYRESTILKAVQEIVRFQSEFFRHGSRYLAPLRQKDVAEALKVHETTISRMANSKYLECEWGIFPISYFFTNAVGTGKQTTDKNVAKISEKAENPENASQNIPLSKEGVKYEIAELLKAHASDKKPLSDQKISDLLAEKGIKVARRTVAKYRAELNINSSYER